MLLLDTHIMLWYFHNSDKLTDAHLDNSIVSGSKKRGLYKTADHAKEASSVDGTIKSRNTADPIMKGSGINKKF